MLQTTVLNSIYDHSLLAYLLVFLAGVVLSIFSCCFIRIPVIIGYISGLDEQSRGRSLHILAFVCGLGLAYSLYGLLLGLIGSLSSYMLIFSPYLYYLLGLIFLALGLSRIGFFRIKIPGYELITKIKPGLANAFLLGILVTFLEAPACPYCGPIIFAMSAHTIGKGDIAYGLSLFLSYGIGQSLIIALGGISVGVFRSWSQKAHRYEDIAAVFSGIILFYAGVYFLWMA